MSSKDPEHNDSEGYSDWPEERLHNLLSEIRRRDVTSWDVESIYTFLTTLHRFDMEDFDEFDIRSSTILGETLRCCKIDPTHTGELFMKMSDKCGTDLSTLILTLCNAPRRVRPFEGHIAAVLLAAQNSDSLQWSTEAVGKLLQRVEESGFNVDVIEVFFHMGQKRAEDITTLGELVHDYLLATGIKDSFECKCKSSECECPIEIDEGVAYITFAGLEQKMNWNEENKNTFFKAATDSLFTSDIMKELGEKFK